MITYPKALRAIIPHLTTIMPAERSPGGKVGKGKRLDLKPLSIRIPEDLRQQLETEAERKGQGWNTTQVVEQALLWYFELITKYRETSGTIE